MSGLLARACARPRALLRAVDALLIDGFHSMTDDVIAELANRGHPGVRASYEFTLRAIDAGADTASELSRRLSVTKQAAAQAIAVLEQLGT